MDWSRIKTILIIVLLVTNVLLGVTYVQSKIAFEQSQRDQLDRVVTLLNQNGIQIETDQMSFPKSLESVEVAFETYTENDVKVFLGENFEQNGDLYTKGVASVQIDEMGLIFKLREIPQTILDMGLPFDAVDDTGALLDLVSSVQEKYGFESDYEIERSYQREGYQIVDAKQVYEGAILDDSDMVLVFYKNNLVYFERSWLTINNDISPNKYDIISLDRALYMTMPKLSSGDEITEIGISYKLNDSSSVVSNLISGEALPFYSIKVSDGNTYYVRAIVEN